MKTRIIGGILLILLSGCATSPEKIKTAYVSPLEYNDYNCKQISGELGRVSRRANELRGSIKKQASDDSTKMAVGLILLWPTLFFIDGDGPEATEYSQIKGERDTLEKVAIQKECDPNIIPKVVVVQDEKTENTQAKSPLYGR